jgi:hypothetical protein
MSVALLRFARPPENLICDFCSSPDKPQHTFVCQSFTVEASGTFLGIPISASNGNWLACPACKQLVNDERWDELARRSTEMFVKAHPDAAPMWNEIYEHMRQVHQEFRSMYRNTQ